MDIEKRKYPRLSSPNNKFCSFKLKGEQDPSGNIMNLSRGGLSFSSTKPVEESIIDLNLTYNDIERQVPSKVKIVWSKPGDVLNFYGGEFVNIKTEDKAELLDSFYENWKKKTLENIGSTTSSGLKRAWVSESR